MNIDNDTVEKIAHLARLELTDTEKDAMITDLNKILDFMDKLNEVDTSAVEPLIYMSDAVNVLRDDVVKHEISHEEALLNAPDADKDFFYVAKVIEK